MLTDIRALADHFLIALPNINSSQRYAGAFRPVERDLGFPTAPVNYGEAF